MGPSVALVGPLRILILGSHVDDSSSYPISASFVASNGSRKLVVVALKLYGCQLPNGHYISPVHGKTCVSGVEEEKTSGGEFIRLQFY